MKTSILSFGYYWRCLPYGCHGAMMGAKEKRFFTLSHIKSIPCRAMILHYCHRREQERLSAERRRNIKSSLWLMYRILTQLLIR